MGGCRELSIHEHVTDSGVGTLVKLPTDEVNIELYHVGMETAQQGCENIACFGNSVVQVDEAKRHCWESTTDGRRSVSTRAAES